MALALRPFGQMQVYPGVSSQHGGPLAYRSATRLDRVEWRNDIFGSVMLHFGMGSYLQGAGAAQVTVRMAMETEDGVRFYLEYISRGDMETHARGETPIMLAGQIDIDPDNEKYAWLNRVQVVGRGMLTRDPMCQSYEMAIVAG